MASFFPRRSINLGEGLPTRFWPSLEVNHSVIDRAWEAVVSVPDEKATAFREPLLAGCCGTRKSLRLLALRQFDVAPEGFCWLLGRQPLESLPLDPPAGRVHLERRRRRPDGLIAAVCFNELDVACARHPDFRAQVRVVGLPVGFPRFEIAFGVQPPGTVHVVMNAFAEFRCIGPGARSARRGRYEPASGIFFAHHFLQRSQTRMTRIHRAPHAPLRVFEPGMSGRPRRQ